MTFNVFVHIKRLESPPQRVKNEDEQQTEERAPLQNTRADPAEKRHLGALDNARGHIVQTLDDVSQTFKGPGGTEGTEEPLMRHRRERRRGPRDQEQKEYEHNVECREYVLQHRGQERVVQADGSKKTSLKRGSLTMN
jgi:hypothetical protein